MRINTRADGREPGTVDTVIACGSGYTGVDRVPQPLYEQFDRIAGGL